MFDLSFFNKNKPESELEMLRSVLYQNYIKKVTGFTESVVK